MRQMTRSHYMWLCYKIDHRYVEVVLFDIHELFFRLKTLTTTTTKVKLLFWLRFTRLPFKIPY